MNKNCVSCNYLFVIWAFVWWLLNQSKGKPMKSKREVRKSIKRMVDNAPNEPNPVGVVVGLVVLVAVVVYLWLKL